MYQIYQIIPGDTLESLAIKFNTTVDNLISINGFSDDNIIEPGVYVVVPNIENGLFYKYIVKKGDSLYSIANKFNTTIDIVENLNGLKKDEYIYPNQELLVPNQDTFLYITSNETLEDISLKSGINLLELVNQNQSIYVVPNQIIVYKNNKIE